MIYVSFQNTFSIERLKLCNVTAADVLTEILDFYATECHFEVSCSQCPAAALIILQSAVSNLVRNDRNFPQPIGVL